MNGRAALLLFAVGALVAAAIVMLYSALFWL